MRASRLVGVILLGAVATLAQASPTIQHWITVNGSRVVFVEAHELPIVDVRIVFDAGAARDGGHPGLARLTNALLEEGAGSYTADDIAEGFSELGAEVGADSLRDMAFVSLRSLSDEDKLGRAVELLATMVAEPSFPPSAVERVRVQMRAGLRAIEQSPGRLAERAFYSALYADHPYASPPDGSERSLTAITREDVRQFHARYYVAANAVIAIVGDLSRPQAERLAAQLDTGLKSGAPAPALPEVEALGGPVTSRVNYPSAQVHLRMGQPGMSRLDPDYFPLFVGNHVLGGSGLVSLLSEEIREKRGFSYSVYSYFSPMRAEGPFIVGLQTESRQASSALDVARGVIAEYIEHGPTEEELDAAKSNITGGFALRLDSNKKILSNVASIGFYGLPLDYLDTYKARVEAVTPAQVRDAFRRHLQPERMVTVLVGPAEGDSTAAVDP